METNNKHPLLIEKAQEEPMYVIKQVFESDLKHLFYVLKNWVLIALVGDHYAYETSDQRKALLAFYESLQMLLVALDILHSGVTEKECCIYNKGSDPSDDYFEFYLISQEKANNPKQLIKAFFHQFSIEHIRREFADWLEAGIDYEGHIPDGITKRHIFSTHKDVVCLVEAAYYLMQEEPE